MALPCSTPLPLHWQAMPLQTPQMGVQGTLSVILGQQDGGCRTVRFGDDPHLEAIPELIGTQQPVTVPEGLMVGLDILGIQIPPVTQGMAIEHGLGNRQLPPSFAPVVPRRLRRWR